MALKLDMSKPYDVIEWPFLHAMFIRMGFPTKWIELIMGCVSTATFSLIVNGLPSRKVIPQLC